MLARRAMPPSPKLHPLAWRGTLTPDIISQPVSPRPKKRWIQIHELKGTRKDPHREAQRWFILSSQSSRRLALDPSFFPHNGQTGWRWIHRSYPHRHPQHRGNEHQYKCLATLSAFTYKNNKNQYRYRSTPSVSTHENYERL